ncbi:hypothetical protein BGZ80_009251 [Entomortierella chlamydospora]|uniref:F-box domain-containing protein n=1 Tax=Entomortierella chlamydospora TaxID=101097 RepID=A0A9P6MXW4_9FUNG|nr:hypothetical protein BGZ79_007124 [Entomortierella chlamydospora]KAG0016397.1 hypothetical protein BGZ80_009251 [Entomortierella chlamydospora]
MPSITSTPIIDKDLALALDLNDLEDDPPLDHEYYLDEIEDDYTTYDLDDEHDYDDIRLAPPTQHKSKQRKSRNKKQETTRQPPFTKIVQPIIDNPRPLAFPLEVLGLVCSHLSQSTLRANVSLVCKDWNAVSDRFIRRFGVWSALSEDYQKRLLEQMKKLDTLECWFNMDPDIPYSESVITQENTRQRWRMFRDAILAPFDNEFQDDISHREQRQKQQQGEHLPKCLLHNIRKLSLRGCFINYSDAIVDLHRGQGLKFLKSFFLEIHQGSRDFLLFPFLDDCPNLLEFTIRVPFSSTVKVLTGDADDLIPDDIPLPVNPETAHFPVRPKPIIPPKEYQQRYNLRVFDIANCTIKHPVIERIVSTCPKLQVLKANDINKQVWIGGLGIYHSYQINHKRLLDHAKIMCPDLKWYNVFVRQSAPTDSEHMERVNTYFPDTRYLSISCCGYQPAMPHALIPRTLFNQITVLEVNPNYNTSSHSGIMNKILCQTPNLLHLIAPKYALLTSELYEPPEPEVVTAPWSFYIENKRARRRQERMERRCQRRGALLRYQNAGSSSTSNSTPGSDDPKVWQCRDLRSFDMGLDSAANSSFVFATYLERNRLFSNLTDLRLSMPTLKVGQRMDPPHVVKQREKKAAEKLRHRQGLEDIKTKELKTPERYPNELLHLEGLRSLEFLHVTVQRVPGMVHPSDFEFLKKQSDETVMRIIPRETNDLDETEGAGSTNNKSTVGDEENDDIQKSEVIAETFWPRLQAFHIRYMYNDSSVIGSWKLASDIGSIRPGVEFSIKQRFAWL